MKLNFSIRQKLIAFSLLGLGFVLLVGSTGLASTRWLSQASSEMAKHTNALKSQMSADMMHDALRADAMRALLAGMQQDTTQAKSIRDDLSAHSKTFTDALADLSAQGLDSDIKRRVDQLRQPLADYLAAARTVVELGLSNPAAAQERMPAFNLAFKHLEVQMDELDDQIEAQATALHAASARAARWTTLIIMATALCASVACLGSGYALGRGILGPLSRATHIARTVAAGDLTSQIEVKSHDELGQLLQALKAMNTQLADLVGAVRASGDSIATGTSQIASGNADLSRRTETQASNLQQTAASMEQLTSTVRHNTEAAQQATALAASASAVAMKGGTVVSAVVATMDEISSSSRKISDIISVIDGIAFQTNILALNAAVEAARAGEQGRGFAVVAGEVRSLARRSADAAKEIKSLIGNSVEKVENGTQLVADAGRTMTEIVTQVQRVSELIGEISSATNEQSGGVAQVNLAVSQLDQVTQQNAALVEESAAAAESLKQQAGKLVEAVRQFTLHR